MSGRLWRSKDHFFSKYLPLSPNQVTISAYLFFGYPWEYLFVMFYKSGLRFSCTQCHKCCRHDPGYVFLSEDDVTAILAYLKMALEEFVFEYCKKAIVGGFTRVSLREKSNNDCIFWNEGCQIYKVRPLQCRLYPFWPSILDSEDAWNKESKVCFGINNGTLHDYQEIESVLRKYEESRFLHCD